MTHFSNNIILTYLFIILFNTLSFAQKYDREKFSPSVNFSAGLVNYFGDLNTDAGISKFNETRYAYSLNFNYKIKDYLGISVNGAIGQISYNQSFEKEPLNFESDIYQFDLRATFHFENEFLIDPEKNVSPYVSVGLGYLIFDPHADLKDVNGKEYYYWGDGTIRNLPEARENIIDSDALERDYVYETRLENPDVNYNRNAFTFPLSAGIEFKLRENILLNIQTTYFITTTKYLDNISLNDKLDKFLYSSLGLTYRFKPW